MAKPKQKRSPRNIRTDYYFRGRVVKTTKAADPNRAAMLCFGHMQINEYGATVAQVTDETTGELHAEFTRSVNGSVRATFARDPRNYVLASTLAGMRKRGLI